MGLFQCAKEISFKWRKVLNESRPRILQDAHLDRTPSNLSITRSVYKERRRVAKENARRKKQAAKRVKQEGRTRFKEFFKLMDDAFDGTITWKQYEIMEDDALYAGYEEVVQQLADVRNRAKAKVDRANEGVSKGCDKVVEITQRTAEKAAEKVQKVAEKMERRKLKRERRRIAKEEKEAKYLMDIEFWNREIEKGPLNEDHWDEEKWEEKKQDEEKRDSCVEHVEHAEDPQQYSISEPSSSEFTIGV